MKINLRNALLALAVMTFAMLFFTKRQDLTPWISEQLALIDGMGVKGVFVFGLIYVLATVLLIPGSVLTLASGFLYGPWYGTLIVSAFSTIGAFIAFLLARFGFRSFFKEKSMQYPKWQRYEKLIEKDSKKITCLLRLSPVFPFNILNYMLGLTSLSSRDYVLASWLGMLPGTFLYVYLGSFLENLTMSPSFSGREARLQQAFFIFGLLITIFLVFYVIKLSSRALKEEEYNES